MSKNKKKSNKPGPTTPWSLTAPGEDNAVPTRPPDDPDADLDAFVAAIAAAKDPDTELIDHRASKKT